MSSSIDALFWILFIYTVCARLLELKTSHRNQRLMSSRGFGRVDHGWSYSIMVTVHTTWFCALLLEHLFGRWQLPFIVSCVALLLFSGAQLLRYWAISSLGTQWNTQVMKPQLPSAEPGVVSVGPFRYIRHPNYLAVIVEFFCLPLIGGAVLTAFIWSAFNGAVLAYRIKLEEKQLMSRPEYSERLGALPRFIPGCRKSR